MNGFYKYKLLQSYLQPDWNPGPFVPNDYFRLEISKNDLSGNKTVTIRNRAHELYTTVYGAEIVNNENLYYTLSTSAVHELKDKYENNHLTSSEKSDLSKLRWSQFRSNTLTLDSHIFASGGDRCYLYLTSLYSNYDKIYGGYFFSSSNPVTDIDLYIRTSTQTSKVELGGQFESLIFGTDSSKWTSSFINAFRLEGYGEPLEAQYLLTPRFTGSTLAMPYDIFNKSLKYSETYKDCKFTYFTQANLNFKDVDNEDNPSDVVMKGVFNGSNITNLSLSFPAGTNDWSINLGAENGSFRTNTLKDITLNIDQSKIGSPDSYSIFSHWYKVKDFQGYNTSGTTIQTFEGINKYATMRVNSIYCPPTESSDKYDCGIPIPTKFDGTVIFKNTTSWANQFKTDTDGDKPISTVYSKWVNGGDTTTPRTDANPLFCLDGTSSTYPEVDTIKLYLGSDHIKTYSSYYYPGEKWEAFIDRQLSMGTEPVFTNGLDKRQMVIENNGYIYPLGKYYLIDGNTFGPSNVEFAGVGPTITYDSRYTNIGPTRILSSDNGLLNHIYIEGASNVGVKTEDTITTGTYVINTDANVSYIS